MLQAIKKHVYLHGSVNVKMTKVGDHAKCPKCRGDARVIWISEDGKTIAIKCTGYHSQISHPSTRFRKNIQKKKKGMVFVIEVS